MIFGRDYFNIDFFMKEKDDAFARSFDLLVPVSQLSSYLVA